MSTQAAPDDIVRTHAEGAANAREPLLVLDPLLAFLDEHGLGPGELEVDADRRGPLQRDLRPAPRGRATSCCAARRAARCRPAPTTCCARRACCGARRPRARARGARRVRRRGRHRRAVLRHGARRGRGRHERAARRARQRRRPPAHRRGARRRARRGPRGRLARRRPGGLRQADRLPRAPAAPLPRPVGAQPHARDPGRRVGRRVARDAPAGVRTRPRSSTATTAWATR